MNSFVAISQTFMEAFCLAKMMTINVLTAESFMSIFNALPSIRSSSFFFDLVVYGSVKKLAEDNKCQFLHNQEPRDWREKSEIINKFIRNMKQNAWANINWNWSRTEKSCITAEKKELKVFHNIAINFNCNRLVKKRVLCLFLLGFCRVCNVHFFLKWIECSSDVGGVNCACNNLV